MILKHLLFRTSLLLCSTVLVACGGSSASNSSVATEDKISEESTSDEDLISSPIVEDETVNLNITWDDNSDNEVEFIIERRIASDVDYETTYYVSENTTSYDDVDLQSGETYCYRISASNSVGDSPSSEKCITL